MPTATIAILPLTISNTVLSLADVPGWQTKWLQQASICKIRLSSGEVNIRYDGGAPTTATTAAAGIPVTSWTEITGREDIQNLKFCRRGGTNAEANIILET